MSLRQVNCAVSAGNIHDGPALRPNPNGARGEEQSRSRSARVLDPRSTGGDDASFSGWKLIFGGQTTGQIFMRSFTEDDDLPVVDFTFAEAETFGRKPSPNSGPRVGDRASQGWSFRLPMKASICGVSTAGLSGVYPRTRLFWRQNQAVNSDFLGRQPSNGRRQARLLTRLLRGSLSR